MASTPPITGAGTLVTPRTHEVEPRCIQASGFVRLPNELVLEVLSYFQDPHREILRAKSGPAPHINLDPEYVERLTTTRRLTMTCWQLRNRLFPILWKCVEGCNFAPRDPPSRARYTPVPPKNGLYPQCSYLLLNPSIGVYVQTISADLRFKGAPRGLTTKFVNCLARLPNLRTLEVFGTGKGTPVVRGFKRNSARFLGVRELVIGDETAEFIKLCPNVETITSPQPLSSAGATILNSEGRQLKKLKRVLGVDEYSVQLVTEGCPDLQEVGVSDSIQIGGGIGAINAGVASHLESLKHLAVVNLDFTIVFHRCYPSTQGARKQGTEEFLEKWKKRLIQVLKDSPSEERKFLRWKFTEDIRTLQREDPASVSRIVIENGELEVLPNTPLAV